MESRVIKFRAWDNKRKFFLGAMAFGGSVTPCEDKERTVFLNHHEDIIVMQFTGLQDSKGVDIYEGDIVNYPFKKFNGKIEFNDGGFCITHNAVCKCELNKAASLSIEVIGNIYEKPLNS